MSALRLVLVLACSAALMAPAVADASWASTAAGSDFVRARSMPAGNQPTASASNRTVVVSWAASNVAPGVPAAGYRVRRYDNSGNLQAIGSACSGTVTGLSCSEQGVPAGTWRYAVLPAHGTNWLGPESPHSTAVTVSAPALAISSSTTVITLPTTLNGTISNFIAGQTVSFRLDDPSTGPALTGTISPTPVQASGAASITVTIPAGTSNGSHTVYAVGSSGDVASAAITVNTLVSTVTTSAWDVRDASSGTESNVSPQPAFAGDGLTFDTGNWTSAFGASRYVDFDMNGPLPATALVSGASFRFSLLAGQTGDTACFYFEVRRASTNALVSTHGSAVTPTACNATSTAQVVTTAIPTVLTAAVANDLRIRVYARESGNRPLKVDLATVTGTHGSTPFTLYPKAYSDATSGTAAATYPWGLSALDGTPFTTNANWAATFSAARSVKFAFPAYVPTGATVTGATLVHAYRSGNGASACIYIEIYAGATLINTHGSAGTPLSCNATGSYVSNTIALPAVTTPARANTLTARIYATVAGNGTRTTLHDVVTLNVTYTGG